MKDREIGSLLFLTDKSYARIKGHLQRKQREKEAMEEEKAYKKYLKQRSDEMAKKWPDSVQNIKKREQERREMKEKMIEKMRIDQFEYYKELNRQERVEFVAKMRNRMKMKKQPNSALSNALLESHIKNENLANLKLRRAVQEEEDEKEAAWIESVYKADKEFKLNEEEKKCKAREKSKKVQAFQLRQIQEKLQDDLHKKTSRLNEEKEDLKKLSDEIRDRKNIAMNDFRNRKMAVKKYMNSENQKKERERSILETEEMELQEVCNIYNNFYRNRCCGIKKQREQNIKDINDAKEKLGLLNKKVDDNKEDKQNDILLKQQMEQENRYQQKQDQNKKKKEKMQYEMDNYYRTMSKKKQNEKNKRAEMSLLKIAERFKNSEKIQKYEEEKKKRIREGEINFTKEWDKQIKENEEIKKGGVPEKVMKSSHEIEDENFFSYAVEVLDYARRKGMDEYPIKREIQKYCKNNQLPIPEYNPECSSKKSLSSRKSEIKLPKI